MSDHAFRHGEVLFSPGDPSEHAYLLQSGSVEILKVEGERRLRVALLGPGEVFGEMGLVEERPRSMMARATTDGTATIMTRAEFEHDLLHDPARCKKYLRSLFERLRGLQARLPDPEGEPMTRPAVQTALVVLHPLTHKAAEVLPDEGLPIKSFPFRIGRASEADEEEPLDLNDVYLLDVKPFNVSRNHLAIDLVGSDRYLVRDRGSLLGTIVNEQRIGGRSPLRLANLDEGDNVLILGGAQSPYQFRLRINRTT
jgi:CRP/FNR family transcriptional regulator, cyclic AMP receptor protein